ncbi:MAG: transposase [Desulfobacterales bacterium]|nr:transposase [Desulfobacterales bacterium]
MHHIIIRGIERKPIFKGKIDYENFVDRLSKILVDTGTACFALALITHHAHFLFRSGPRGIASLMRRLLACYAASYNSRNRRPCQSSLTGQAWSAFPKQAPQLNKWLK